MATFIYIKALLISILIMIVLYQTARVSDLKTENEQLQNENSFKPVQKYESLTYEDFLNHLDWIGNRDTVFSQTCVIREINHWVPGKIRTDTVDTKCVVHISVETKKRL